MYTEYKRGFISSLFMLLLISISSVCAVMLYKIECDLKSIDNMAEVNQRFAEEVKIISFIKCQLANDSLKSGTYLIEDEEIIVEYNGDFLIWTANNGEIMYIYLNNGRITDYIYKIN